MEEMRKRLMKTMYNPELLGADPQYGSIPGVEVGKIFESRQECSALGVHPHRVAGITGNLAYGAYSICVSGGYEDRDEGDFLVYTGTGGQEDSYSGNGKQVKDQTFKNNSNASLKLSQQTGRPVRVIRGPRNGSKYAPASGYRYDGLYKVEKAYMDKSTDGEHMLCKFELRRIDGQPPIPVNSKPRAKRQAPVRV